MNTNLSSQPQRPKTDFAETVAIAIEKACASPDVQVLAVIRETGAYVLPVHERAKEIL